MRQRRSGTWWVLLAACAIGPIAACDRTGTGSGRDGVAAEGAAGFDLDKPLEPPTGAYNEGIRVLQAGREPRTVLRYVSAIGSSQLITSRHDHGTGVWEDGQRVSIEQAPDTVAVVRLEPLAWTEGGVHIRGELQGLWVSEEDPEGWEEWSDEFEAMSATAMEQSVATTYVPSGRVFSDPAENDTERAHGQSMLHLSMLSPVVLPEEPIGIGAVWEMSESAEMAMIVTRIQRRYRLRSIQGNRIVVEMSQRHTGMPGPTSTSTHDYAELLSREAVVHGEAEMDLTLPGPVTGWFESDFSTRVRVHKGEDWFEVASRTNFRYTWEPYEEEEE